MTIVGAGITLHEALASRRALAGDGIEARVIDLYSVKPLDAATLRSLGRDGRWSRSRTTGPRAASARRCSRRSRTTTTRPPVVSLAVREMPALGQAGRAAPRGRDRRRRGSRSGAPARCRARQRVVEGFVQPLLLLARGAVCLGPVRARLDDPGDRRLRDFMPQTLECKHRRAAERRLRHARDVYRPCERVGHDLDPVAARAEARLPSRRLRARQVAGRRSPRTRNATPLRRPPGAGRAVSSRRVSPWIVPRACGFQPPRALAAEEGQERQTVVARIALRERSRRVAERRSSHP